MTSKPLIAVGLSGGVDSSVTALRLKNQGENILGLFMQNWEEEADGPCTQDKDRRDALRVAAHLGIPFRSCNFVKEYWDNVFSHVISEYQAGRTPNPDVLCNREIKFKSFLNHALSLGATKVATGHYARVDCVDGRWRLLRGLDDNKDQTFFLHALGQYELAHALFPVGDMPKPDVRQMASEAGLLTATKKDSVGICFIGPKPMREFLSQYIKSEKGPMMTPDGQIVGEHVGTAFYTIGQRGGLGIGGTKGTNSEPWFVAGKNRETNTLYVVQGGENAYLKVNTVWAENLTWTSGSPPSHFRAVVKYRHRQKDQAVEAEVVGGEVVVHFDEPQYGVAPGQSVVFYDGEECLGGAVIRHTDALVKSLC